jgi:error-prone DNA polymerase
MGFYAPDSLVHEAQLRGVGVLSLDVNASAAQCTVEGGGVRLGLGYIKGVAEAAVTELVAERERGGPFRTLGELAARTGASRGTLEALAWSGACEALSGDGGRRAALWRLGTAAPGQGAGEGTQLALPLALPQAPRLRKLGRWQQLIADYSTSGVSLGEHAMAILRPRIEVPMLATSAQLGRLPNGCAVAVAGLVIARQRPSTAKGIMFLLFEDEWGTINLIVPKATYERNRALARAEPLLLARGRLERSEGVINVLVRELAPLERFLSPDAGEPSQDARVRHLPTGAEPAQLEPAAEQQDAAAEVGASMRAAAPPVQSFAMGRRR